MAVGLRRRQRSRTTQVSMQWCVSGWLKIRPTYIQSAWFGWLQCREHEDFEPTKREDPAGSGIFWFEDGILYIAEASRSAKEKRSMSQLTPSG